MRIYRDYGNHTLSLETNHRYEDQLIQGKIEKVLYYLMTDLGTNVFDTDLGCDSGLKEAGVANVLSLSRMGRVQAALLDVQDQYYTYTGERIALNLDSFVAENDKVYITVSIDDVEVTIGV